MTTQRQIEADPRVTFINDSVIEREANIFAVELLIPEKWIRRDAPDNLDIESDPRIVALAAQYGVSQQLMVMRLMELKLLG